MMKNLFKQIILSLSGIVLAFTMQAQDTTGKAISPEQFEKRMHKRKVTVLDVRTPEEFAEGHLHNAVHLNVLDSIAFVNGIQSLRKNWTYLLYCKSGRRSGKALVIMQAQGFKKLYHMDGGITAWKGPVEKNNMP